LALAETIESLRANSVASLDAAHDYYTHTRKLWRLLQVAVEREGRKFTLKNPQTGRVVNQDDMLRLAQPYVELNEIKYRSLKEWFDFLGETVNLGCPTEEEIEQLAEIKVSRDILVHSNGVVNETYTRKAGDRARFAPRQMLDIPEPYHRESWLLIKKIINDIAGAAVQRI
jgi:hypothetical protein